MSRYDVDLDGNTVCGFCGCRWGDHVWDGGDPCYYDTPGRGTVADRLELGATAERWFSDQWNRIAAARKDGTT